MYDIYPEDIVFLISQFLYGNCNKCNKICHYETLTHNWKPIKYKTIFDDSYYFTDELDEIKLICNNCVSHFFIRTKFE
jgi:hypothetical protein